MCTPKTLDDYQTHQLLLRTSTRKYGNIVLTCQVADDRICYTVLHTKTRIAHT